MVRLAPDNQVKACEWYVPEFNENGKEFRVSHNKRIKYAIRASLPDTYLKDELDTDFIAQNQAVRDAIELLNKHTHVGPCTFRVPPAQVDAFVDKTLAAFLGFSAESVPIQVVSLAGSTGSDPARTTWIDPPKPESKTDATDQG